MLLGMSNGAAVVENSLAVPPRLNIELPHDPEIPLIDIYLRNWNRCSNRSYTNVHDNTLNSSQKVETTQMSTN